MKEKQSILKKKPFSFFLNLVAPIQIREKKQLYLNVAWLALAFACAVCGIILGLTTSLFDAEMRFLNFWYTLSLLCGVAFICKMIKSCCRMVRASVAFGKTIQYTETSVSQVGGITSNIYEVKKEKKNIGKITGLVAAILSLVGWMILLAFVGFFVLVARFTLTIREILIYSRENTTQAQETTNTAL